MNFCDDSRSNPSSLTMGMTTCSIEHFRGVNAVYFEKKRWPPSILALESSSNERIVLVAITDSNDEFEVKSKLSSAGSLPSSIIRPG